MIAEKESEYDPRPVYFLNPLRKGQLPSEVFDSPRMQDFREGIKNQIRVDLALVLVAFAVFVFTQFLQAACSNTEEKFGLQITVSYMLTSSVSNFLLLAWIIPFSMAKMYVTVPENSNLQELVLIRKIRFATLALIIGLSFIVQLILSLLLFTVEMEQSRIFLKSRMLKNNRQLIILI